MKLTQPKDWYERRIAIEGDKETGAGTLAEVHNQAASQSKFARVDIADQLFALAQDIAKETPGFQDRLGPGKDYGNGATTRYLVALDAAVKSQWPTECRLQEPAAQGLKYSFDYFIPSERTAVEIALSVRNIVTEFEKDVFKAILAKEAGKPLSKLIVIGKSGSIKRQNGPGPVAIRKWVREHCAIEIEVKELV